jgi:hypothetical protein
LSEPFSGYQHKFDTAVVKGQVIGSIQMVAPNGRYIYFPIRFEFKTLENEQGFVEKLVDSACFEIKKQLCKLLGEPEIFG